MINPNQIRPLYKKRNGKLQKLNIKKLIKKQNDKPRQNKLVAIVAWHEIV